MHLSGSLMYTVLTFKAMLIFLCYRHSIAYIVYYYIKHYGLTVHLPGYYHDSCHLTIHVAMYVCHVIMSSTNILMLTRP